MKTTLFCTLASFSLQEFLEHNYGIDANTSATIIITILIFLLGYILNSLAKSFSEFLVRNKGRKVFIANLKQLEKTLKSRQEILSEQLQNLEKSPNKVYAGGVHFYSIEVLREIGFKNSFDFFLSGWENYSFLVFSKDLKQKAFNKVWSILSIIEYWDKSSKEEVFSFQKAMNEMLEKKIPHLTPLSPLIDNYFISPNVNQTQREIDLKEHLRQIINNWKQYSDDINNITELKLRDYYLTPIKELTWNFRDIQIAREIYQHANDAFYWNNNMINIASAF